MTKDVVARLPIDDGRGDDWCSVCGDDNVVAVIEGKERHSQRTFCPDSVILCSKCFGIMKDNIRELGILERGEDI